MFHHVMVNQRDRDALRFIWRNNRDENFQDIQMNVPLFGKVNSPCYCIWALNKTASDKSIDGSGLDQSFIEARIYDPNAVN